MKLVMTLLVRDVDDQIAANLEFHRRLGVDHFIVMDNLSTDATRAILAGYERQGLVTYMYQADDTYSQARWVTGMARIASQHGADWVINNDADEFWYPTGSDLKGILSAVPSEFEAVAVPRLHFVPKQLPPGAPFWEALTVRYAATRKPSGEEWPGKVCHRGRADIEVGYGNHTANAGGRALPATQAPIEILHFPIRSYDKFERTVVNGGAANARNPERPVKRWEMLFEMWQRGELRAYFDALVPDDAALEAGLRDGRYVRDERLKDALSR